MNKKQLTSEIQSLKKSVASLEVQLKERLRAEHADRREMSSDIHTRIANSTELHLPIPGIATLSVPGDPQGRRYVKVVDLMLAIMEHLKLTLEYKPSKYVLKEKRKEKK